MTAVKLCFIKRDCCDRLLKNMADMEHSYLENRNSSGEIRSPESSEIIEVALGDRSAEFWAFAESVDYAVFVCQNEKLCYVNPAAAAISGYAKDELLDMSVWDIVDSHTLNVLWRLERQRQESAFLRYELDLITDDGHERCLDLVVTSIQHKGYPAVLGVAVNKANS